MRTKPSKTSTGASVAQADEKYAGQRKAIAARFRRKYNSDVAGIPNANPDLVGVFDDTVASGKHPAVSGHGGRRRSVPVAPKLGAVLVVALTFWTWLLSVSVFAGAVAVIWYVVSHLRYATGLEGYTFWETLHFTAPKMKFYDPHLDNEVEYARQALSLDENRNDFAIVKWGSKSNKGPPGTDSDIGLAAAGVVRRQSLGHRRKLPQEQSQAFDISLKWMVHAATALPDKAGPRPTAPASRSTRSCCSFGRIPSDLSTTSANPASGPSMAKGAPARRSGGHLAFICLREGGCRARPAFLLQ